MKLCIKCGREMKRTLLMNTVSEEYFQKYNCFRCGVEIWENIHKESVNNEQNNVTLGDIISKYVLGNLTIDELQQALDDWM